jgi:hypothetical protein
MKRFNRVPQKLRPYVNQTKKVKMPVRKVLSRDAALIQYNKEVLLLYTDLAIAAAEQLLDSEITPIERLHIQASQNQLYDMNKIITSNFSKKMADLHDDRVDFLSEVMTICTLVKPKFFEKVQNWLIERVRIMHNLKD